MINLTKKNKIIIASVCAAIVILVIILTCVICLNNKNKKDNKVEDCTYLSFELNSDGTGYSVTDVLDKSLTELIIPSTYKGLPVTSIATYAITTVQAEKIYIPESVISIADNAFDYNSNIKEVTIMNKNISIGNRFLRQSNVIETINFNGTKEEWNAVSKGSTWDEFLGQYNYTIKCTDGDISMQKQMS